METRKDNTSVQDLNQRKESKSDIPVAPVLEVKNSNPPVAKPSMMETKKNDIEYKSASHKDLKNSDEAVKQTTSMFIQMGLISGPMRDKSRTGDFDGDYEPTHSEIRDAAIRDGQDDFADENNSNGCLARLFGCWSSSTPNDECPLVESSIPYQYSGK